MLQNLASYRMLGVYSKYRMSDVILGLGNKVQDTQEKAINMIDGWKNNLSDYYFIILSIIQSKYYFDAFSFVYGWRKQGTEKHEVGQDQPGICISPIDPSYDGSKAVSATASTQLVFRSW